MFETLGNLTLEELFKDYAYHEEWSPDNYYTTDSFVACYDGIYRRYVWLLLTIGTGDEQRNYVVARLVPNINRDLLDHCDCVKCLCSDYNPLKKMLSPYLTECIDIGELVSQRRVRQSRRRKLLSPRWRLVDNWVRWVEVLIVIMVILY